MNKAAWRKQARAWRAALAPDEAARRSQQIATQWLTHTDLRTIRALHVFLPIPGKGEVDTWPLIRRLWQHHPKLRLVTSRADLDAGTLTHFCLMPDTVLQPNAWGVPEPVGAVPFPVTDIDTVLVPLLICDGRGHRVGYGKGFYDRFLAQCRADVRRVGLSHFPAVGAIADVQPTDVPLDRLVTPDGVVVFEK